MSKPILCVDFDGVIHSYTSGWKGACEIPDPPVRGALSWLYAAGEHWQIAIYSSRSKEPGAIEAMQKWLRKHADTELNGLVPIGDFMDGLSFPTQKPAANMTIDDRALCFEGDWSRIDAKALLDFKPWNKRGLGATGTFPDGALNEDDEGELRMAVGYDKIDGVVRLEFGKPIAGIGLPPGNAVALARLLLQHAGAKIVEISF